MGNIILILLVFILSTVFFVAKIDLSKKKIDNEIKYAKSSFARSKKSFLNFLYSILIVLGFLILCYLIVF
tara:strand:- start:169 stop:378 length:210 start_codon:yes stop_codon:yes gene_type:complete